MTFILRRYKVRGNSAGAVRAAMPPETATILASTGARAMQRITVRWASQRPFAVGTDWRGGQRQRHRTPSDFRGR